MAEIGDSSNQGWWVIATSIFYQAFAYGVFLYSFTFWIAPWSAEFNVPSARVVLAMSLGNISASIAAVFVGRLVDRVPVVHVVCCGLALFATGFYLISIANAFWHILLVYTLLFGIAISGVGQLTAQTLAVRWFVKRRSVAIGWVSIGSSIGGLTIPPIITLLAGDVGWRQTHLLLACIFALVILPIAWLMIKEPEIVHDAKIEPADQLLAPPVSTLARYRQILTQRRFWIIYLVLTPMVLGVYLFVVNLAPYGVDIGISIPQTAMVMSVTSLAMICGKIGSGMLFHHWPTGKTLLCILLLLGLALMILVSAPGYGLLLIAGSLLGASAGSYLTVSGTLVAMLYPQHEFASVTGLVLFSNALAFLIVPVSSVMRDLSGSYAAVWLLLIGAVLVGMAATRSINALVLQRPLLQSAP